MYEWNAWSRLLNHLWKADWPDDLWWISVTNTGDTQKTISRLGKSLGKTIKIWLFSEWRKWQTDINYEIEASTIITDPELRLFGFPEYVKKYVNLCPDMFNFKWFTIFGIWRKYLKRKPPKSDVEHLTISKRRLNSSLRFLGASNGKVIRDLDVCAKKTIGENGEGPDTEKEKLEVFKKTRAVIQLKLETPKKKIQPPPVGTPGPASDAETQLHPSPDFRNPKVVDAKSTLSMEIEEFFYFGNERRRGSSCCSHWNIPILTCEELSDFGVSQFNPCFTTWTLPTRILYIWKWMKYAPHLSGLHSVLESPHSMAISCYFHASGIGIGFWKVSMVSNFKLLKWWNSTS